MKKSQKQNVLKQVGAKSQQKKAVKKTKIENLTVRRSDLLNIQTTFSNRIDSLMLNISTFTKVLVDSGNTSYEKVAEIRTEMVNLHRQLRMFSMEAIKELGQTAKVADITDYIYNKISESDVDLKAVEHLFGVRKSVPSKEGKDVDSKEVSGDSKEEATETKEDVLPTEGV